MRRRLHGTSFAVAIILEIVARAFLEEFFGDQPKVKSNFISTLGYGDPATIFERSPRPDFDKFNSLI